MAVWLIWVIAAVVLAIAEMLSVNLVLIMCAGGAAAGALVAALGLPVALQLLVFAVVAVGLLILVRPVALRHLQRGGDQSRTGVEALVGRTATVVSTVDGRGGRVKIGGDEWSARAYDEHQVLSVGDSVRVMEIRGVTAVVWAEP